METLDQYKRKINTAENLQSVVKTMKVLSAVNIRQFEKAVNSLNDYYRTVEMGLQVVMQKQYREIEKRKKSDSTSEGRYGIVVFGTDQGMCGQFNDEIVSHGMEYINKLGIDKQNRVFLAIGFRVATRIQDAGEQVERSINVPGSVSGITSMVLDVLLNIENWHLDQNIGSIVLIYNKFNPDGSTYQPYTFHLLPFNRERYNYLLKGKWPSRVLPTFTMNADQLFSGLVRQYIFVSIYRAFAESLASENASRLESIQRAERNISERLEKLNFEYNKHRQTSITEELLDIVTGFEALKSK